MVLELTWEKVIDLVLRIVLNWIEVFIDLRKLWLRSGSSRRDDIGSKYSGPSLKVPSVYLLGMTTGNSWETFSKDWRLMLFVPRTFWLLRQCSINLGTASRITYHSLNFTSSLRMLIIIFKKAKLLKGRNKSVSIC